MKSIFTLVLACFFIGVMSAQNPGAKKILDHEAAHIWKRIKETQVTTNGEWVAYVLTPNTEGDAQLALWNARTQKTKWFERADQAHFTANDSTLVFRVQAPLDTLKEQRRRKVKKDDLPKDSLFIYQMATGKLRKIPDVSSFSVPEEWSGWLVCKLEEDKSKPKKDSTAASKEKPKKEGKENGYRLLLVDLNRDRMDTVFFATSYTLAKKHPLMAFHTSGKPDGLSEGAYLLNFASGIYLPLLKSEGEYKGFRFSEDGSQLAFLVNRDTTKARVKPWELRYWSRTGGIKLLAQTGSSFLPIEADGNWVISEYGTPEFSEDGSKLFFGVAPPPILEDTTLLPEEKVMVEVWTWEDPDLYTEQNVQIKSKRQEHFPAVYFTKKDETVLLGSPELPSWRFTPDRNANWAVAYTDEPYRVARQWEGEANKDMYIVNLESGAQTPIGFNLRGSPALSPGGGYVVWWSDPDSAWFSYNTRSTGLNQLTNNDIYPYYDERNDVPDYPSPYGYAGWLKNEEALIVYDKNDLWVVDPNGAVQPRRLTKGRTKNVVYRYIRLDPEEKYIDPAGELFLHVFNETTRDEGYAWLNLSTGKLTPWYQGEFAFTNRVLKAKKANVAIFTCENFQTFPDLLYSEFQPGVKMADPKFKRISNVNPQQKDYKWGTIELVDWTSPSGESLEGLLVKPEDFDPGKQYPMMVYFYERLSDRLHRHQAPDVHRSSINATIYASQGYLVFYPDIHYTVGFPGKDAYDAVTSGVSKLIDLGFVDKNRVGLQGHSWGGYQTAYIITRTNMFACAEAGAPVANMTSAYGGIRWASGRNRQFQYEHTQSRIGGSLWEYPNRYIENSPLFSLDKVETPLLILHNDADGAVPWYQGIELFTGLRRLGRPCWLLNYNDEPHWPVKLQNRIDFQTRMLDFFNFYLQDGPKPEWMDRGVPAIEKGMNRG